VGALDLGGRVLAVLGRQRHGEDCA